MKKRVIGALISLLCLFSLILAAGTWYFSNQILYPQYKCNIEHYRYCKDPGEIPLDFETIEFSTSDNVLLKGWYIPAHDSSKTVVMVNGHGSDQQEGLRYASALHQAGYNLLLYNSRLFSGGEKAMASMGYHEVKDVKAAVDFAISKSDSVRVGTLGFSMGAATSIVYMAEDERVKAGAFSSSYASVVDEFSDVGSRDYGLPDFPLLTLAIALTNFRGNMNLYEIVPEQAIKTISPRPVLIMHCDQDDYINYSHAQRLYKAAGQPKEMWTATCNRHERVWNSDPQKAESVVVSFFDRYL